MARRVSPRPGEWVTLADVASYAAGGHKECNGTGYYRKDLGQLCECAKGRFLEANIFRVWPDADADALRWGPNPPTADELAEVGRRAASKDWEEFQKSVMPDKPKETP